MGQYSKVAISAGGQAYAISHVRLYHRKAIEQWQQLLASAQQHLVGQNTGIGLIGSPGWVVSAGLILGAIEGAANSSAQKRGATILGEAKNLFNEMIKRSEYFAVSEIAAINQPVPGIWHANRGGINFSGMGEEFIIVLTEDGTDWSIRWSEVSAFRAF